MEGMWGEEQEVLWVGPCIPIILEPMDICLSIWGLQHHVKSHAHAQVFFTYVESTKIVYLALIFKSQQDAITA